MVEGFPSSNSFPAARVLPALATATVRNALFPPQMSPIRTDPPLPPPPEGFPHTPVMSRPLPSFPTWRRATARPRRPPSGRYHAVPRLGQPSGSAPPPVPSRTAAGSLVDGICSNFLIDSSNLVFFFLPEIFELKRRLNTPNKIADV